MNAIRRWIGALAAAVVLGTAAAGAVALGGRDCGTGPVTGNAWEWLASPALSRALSVLAGTC